MNVSLKVGLGLFVGIMAAVAAFKGPAWWEQHQAQVADDRHRQFLNTLTPQRVISLCGKPSRDEVKTSSYRPERHLVYHGAREAQVKLLFVGSSKQNLQMWRYEGIRNVNASTPTDVAEKWAEQHRSYGGLVTELPCLLLK
jgi:hypothetical protein